MRRIFNVNCAGCHPHGGNSMASNLPVKGFVRLVSQKAFVKFICTPKMPDGSAGAMPAFPKFKISEKQAKKLFKYVSSLDPFGGQSLRFLYSRRIKVAAS